MSLVAVDNHTQHTHTAAASASSDAPERAVDPEQSPAYGGSSVPSHGYVVAPGGSADHKLMVPQTAIEQLMRENMIEQVSFASFDCRYAFASVSRQRARDDIDSKVDVAPFAEDERAKHGSRSVAARCPIQQESPCQAFPGNSRDVPLTAATTNVASGMTFVRCLAQCGGTEQALDVL